jgi:hypothetical protein
MLSVEIQIITLVVVILNGVMLVFVMLIDELKSITVVVVMLNVVMPSDVARLDILLEKYS